MTKLINSYYDIFKKGSKTYFNASLFFPKNVRDDIAKFYAFVRVADDFVDSIPQKKNEFIKFKQEYKTAVVKNNSSNQVIMGMLDLINKYNIDNKLVLAFLDSMESDLHKSTYNTFYELKSYMYGSAEVIGLIIIKILGLKRVSAKNARILGKSMQLINFIRDILEDIHLNRQYIPTTHLKKFNLDKINLTNLTKTEEESFILLIRHEIDIYNKWMVEAEKGYKYIPYKYLIAIKTASDMYKYTADIIYKNPLIIFKTKVKPSVLRIHLTGLYNLVSLYFKTRTQ